MSQAKLPTGLRAVHCVPKIGIPLLLFAVLWVVAGGERLMDALARFTFDAYFAGTAMVGLAVLVVTVVLSHRRS